MVLPKIVYCLNPVLKVSETMAHKFERIQKDAIKIIHSQSKSCRECGLMTILNQKRYKAALLMFKCLQGTALPHFASCINKVEHKHNSRGNLSMLGLPNVRRLRGCEKVIYVSRPCLFDLRTLNSLTMFKHKLKEYLLNN